MRQELQRFRDALRCVPQPFARRILTQVRQDGPVFFGNALDQRGVVLIVAGIAVHLIFLEHLFAERHDCSE